MKWLVEWDTVDNSSIGKNFLANWDFSEDSYTFYPPYRITEAYMFTTYSYAHELADVLHRRYWKWEFVVVEFDENDPNILGVIAGTTAMRGATKGGKQEDQIVLN